MTDRKTPPEGVLWMPMRVVDQRFAAGLHEFSELLNRLRIERTEAAPIVASIVRGLPLTEALAEIPSAWRTVPIVQELCAYADDPTTRSALKRVSAARLAVSIARVLDDRYPRTALRLANVDALRALADALRAANSPIRSLSAIGAADSLLLQCPLAEESARVDLSAARTLITLRLCPEATERLAKALYIFTSLGMSRHVAQCQQLQQQLVRLVAGRTSRADALHAAHVRCRITSVV